MATANSPAVYSPELNARYCGLDRETMQRAFRLMHTARRLDDREVMLNAQHSAAAFYARHGFISRGPDFLEVGIAHVEMFTSRPLETAAAA